ncbi:hypothetical protein VTO73DRAFT_7149 [Trametes versicolor]
MICGVMAHKMLLTELPDEILSMVVQAADRDLKTLSSLSLVCRALLPVVREHMFTVVNARALEEACMRPYLVHITELQIGKPDIAAYARDTADCRFIPLLSSCVLPKLRSLHIINNYTWFYVDAHPALYETMLTLTSVTGLTLSCKAFFVDLQHLQTMVCALPNLAQLSLGFISFDFSTNRDTPEGYTQVAERISPLTSVRPKLSTLSMIPSLYSDAVAGWLGSGLSKHSLSTLCIPPNSMFPYIVLQYFGPNIQHLHLPLNDMQNYTYLYAPCLGTYTSLRTLTVFLGARSNPSHTWELLLIILEDWLPAERLETVTIDMRSPPQNHIRAAYTAEIDWSDILGRLDEVLVGPKFVTLRTVEIFVQATTQRRRTEEIRDEIVTRIEECMKRLAAAGKLVASA